MTTLNLSIRLGAEGQQQLESVLRSLGQEGEAALGRIQRAGEGPTRDMQALGAAGERARDALGGLGDLAGPVKDVLGALADVHAEAVRVASEGERAQHRVEGALRATGGRAGVTAKEISDLAAELSGATLLDDDQIKSAAAALTAVRGVSGEVFKDTIRLAADMSSVFGGDLTAAATRLGKALQDPAKGLDALHDAGIDFSDEQRRLVRTLAETGRAAEAQREILGVLAERVGGSAAAENTGLAGASRSATKEYEAFLETVADAMPLESASRGWARFWREARGLAEGPTAEREIKSLVDAVAKAEDELKRLEERQAKAPRALRDAAAKTLGIDGQQAEVERLRGELDARIEAERQARRKEDEDRAAARATARAKPRAGDARREDAPRAEPPPDPGDEARAAARMFNAEATAEAVRQEEDRRAASDRAKAVIAEDVEAGRRVQEATRTEAERHAAEVARLSGLLDRGRIDQETFNRAMRDADPLMRGLGEAGERAFDRMGAGIAKMAVEGRVSLKGLRDLGVSVVNELMQEFIKLAIVNPLKEVIFGRGSPVRSGASSIVGTLIEGVFGPLSGGLSPVTAAANHQYLLGGGSVALGWGGPRAGGGPVEPGHLYLVNERRTERSSGPGLFLPLAPGRIDPHGGEGGRVSVTVVDQRGAGAPPARVSEGRGGDGEREITVLIQDAVETGIFDGRFDAAMRTTYGLRPAGQ